MSKQPKRKTLRSSSLPKAEGRPLDLAQFNSLEDAFAKVEPGDRYLEVGKILLGVTGDIPLSLASWFWFSMITRSEGLHGAIAREVKEGNPQAVFPLIRGLAESVVVLMYTLDHPEYVEAIIDSPRELAKTGIRRKTMQALISHASKQAPGMKAVYADLSEATHFGSIAMWSAHRIEGEDGDGTYRASWQSTPRWRDDEQAFIACAQTLELADAMEFFLREFCHRHVLPSG